LRHDNHRSSVSPEQLPLDRLALAWTHGADQPPRPAWPGPARWDAYVKRARISSMRNYDESFHITAAGGAVYFGSSADDAVYCLDAGTGRLRWRYTVGGPVRLPPTIAGDRLYFGSDDGFAYCLSTDGKTLHWKLRPSPPQMVLQDGRLISQWPVRTGVLVTDGIAYFGGSLLPWETSYFCAVDAGTGKVGGAGTYVRRIEQATLEGSVLATERQLIVTQGRAAPLSLTRGTGESQGILPGVVGGSFALIAPNGNRYFGPGSHEGFVSEADAAHRAVITRKLGATAVVAQDGLLYVLERGILGCLQLKPEKWLWRRPSDLEEALILAGDTLIAGGRGQVVAFRTDDGTPIWWAEVAGRAQSLAVADGTLLVSTDVGRFYAFRAAADGKIPLPSKEYRVGEPPDREPLPTVHIPTAIRRGPMIHFTAPGAARVTWSTTDAMPTTLLYGIDALNQRYHNPTPAHEHEVMLRGLRHNEVYKVALTLHAKEKEHIVGPFECDTHFNYTLRAVAQQAGSPESKIAEPLADALLAQAGRKSGICVLSGLELLPLGMALATRSDFHVMVLDSDERRIATARRQLQGSGFYGTRLAIVSVADLSEIPATSGFANCVVVAVPKVEPTQGARIKELARITAPQTGRFYLQLASAKRMSLLSRWLPAATHTCTAWQNGVLVTKSATAESGTWTHQYGRADNATFAGESLQGACRTDDFQVQWLGQPGPRFQSDRGNRKPAPLYAAGKLFVQGLDRLLALDANNGTILWNVEIPGLRRFNIRNDSANWCADDERLYLAVRDACWVLDATTGGLAAEYIVPSAKQESAWGYVGREGNLLIGSRAPLRSAYQEFWGGQFWYSDSDGPLAGKVISDTLFAIDAASGQKKWQYQGGAIVHTSITLTPDAVVFAESPLRTGKQLESGRATNSDFWAELQVVALSLEDGRQLWRVPAEVGPANTMFSVACGRGTVVAVASAKGNYRVVVRRLTDGSRLWATSFPWEAKDKGGDSARPAIVGDKLFISPRSFDLASGTVLPLTLTRGACGSYAAAANVFVTRLGNLGLWDPRAHEGTSWHRLRPDCWLSAIPAGGMILAPEGGGGCSCGGWIETSIAFAPKPKPAGSK